MSYLIEIWRSINGGSYSLLDTVSGGGYAPLTLGNEYVKVDAPVTEGSTYAYKARRYDTESGLYSGFSDPFLVHAEDEPTGDCIMANAVTGAKSLLGIGTQPDFATSVKVSTLGEYRSGQIDAGVETLYGEAILDSPVPRHKYVAGDFKGAGSYTFEVTPRKFLPKILNAIFGAPTTTTIAQVTGPPLIPAHYRHKFIHGWNRNYLTVVQKINSTINVYGGCTAHKLDLTATRGDKSVVTASVGIMAANRWRTDTVASVTLDTATYDSLPPYPASRGVVKICDFGGSLLAAARFKSFNFAFDRNSQDEYGFNGLLGPFQTLDSTSTVEMDLDAYFNSEDDLDRFFGYAAGAFTAPNGFTGVVKPLVISASLFYPSGTDGYNNELTITFPCACYGTVGEAIQDRNSPIMQKIKLMPVYDGTATTDVTIEVVSDETRAAIIAADTTLTVPSNIVNA